MDGHRKHLGPSVSRRVEVMSTMNRMQVPIMRHEQYKESHVDLPQNHKIQSRGLYQFHNVNSPNYVVKVLFIAIHSFMLK